MTDSQQIIDAYREALRLVHGEERANESPIYYIQGWYYISIAQRFPDGSVGVYSRATSVCRKAMVVKKTEVLLKESRAVLQGVITSVTKRAGITIEP